MPYKHPFHPHPLAALILLAFAAPALAEEAKRLGEVVVTAPRMDEPLTVTLDPRAPQQPVPANDGAALLKNIPGFEVIRKGGADGDPVLRGLAGSRLNVLLDGADFHGSCGMRMDPPTAYVFPETYDRVTVIKGPQTVLYGNGNAAGVVLFDRAPQPAPGVTGFASVMAGAWGRLDGVVNAAAAGDKAYVDATASHAESGDYKDGAGKRVHSSYERESLNARAGWLPDRDTRLELSASASRAEAAYADRSMDGVKFDREAYGLKLEKTQLSPLLQAVKAQVNYNYIDHVMDNYSLRTKAAGNYTVNNPDRATKSVRVSADLALSAPTLLTVGADWQNNEHSLRQVSSASQAAADAYEGRPRIRDMDTTIQGLFGELRHELAGEARLIGGLRIDDWSADRYNSANGAYMAGADEALKSGFLRFEQDIAGRPATAFVGFGYSQRPMDYWEASTYNGILAGGRLNPEKNGQLDAGLIWKSGKLSGSVSVFYSKVADYILTYASPMAASPYLSNCANKMGTWYCSGNIDATRYGGEADLAWRFAPAWTLRGSLAYVHGDNDSRDVPLAQTPPLDTRLGLDYTTGAWTLGSVLRMVAKQDRYDVGYGNIVGQDYGRTAGFATLSFNAAYKAGKGLLFTAGIDNVFDKNYAEHLARDNSFEAGAGTRVSEPGRFVWAKLNYRY